MSKPPKLVLCIPGPWTSREDLAREIAASVPEYRFADGVLRDTLTGFACELVLQDADPDLEDDFRAAGPHWANTEAMADVGEHASVAYLAGPGGSRQEAEGMMLAGAALVDAGGLGVKVDSTGIAHGPAYWIDLCEQLDSLTAHRALVVFLTGREVYSCGMHNFGLPEAIVSPVGGDRREAADLLRAFTHYLFAHAPLLEDGHTFSVSEGTPVYRVRAVEAIDYGPASLFNNPYGAWRLEPEQAGKKAGWWSKLRHQEH